MSVNGAYKLHPTFGEQISAAENHQIWINIQKLAKTNKAVNDRLTELLALYILVK